MSETLYASLARDIQAAISAGRQGPGSLLPGEHALALAHGVSRATVRAALSVLERDGIVERRRGAGTRVLSPRAKPGYGQSVHSIDELIHYARDTHRIVRSTRQIVADVALAHTIGVAAGTRWLHVRSLRVDPARPRRPICASDAWVAAEFAAVKTLLSDRTTALCDLLARHYGASLGCIEQEMQGAVIPAELADVLVARAGDAALRILRRYRDPSGWAYLVTVGLHPADRFTYRMRLERSALSTAAPAAGTPTSPARRAGPPSSRRGK
ncbi:MAG: GntR family transcriptional regulator [Burkholderiales bacterium]